MDDTADTIEFLEGDEAYHTWEECPYELGTVAHQNWMRGFVAAWNEAIEETQSKLRMRGRQL